mmetsp:Transcript_67061/g.190245  ORF Transcript_67061/g.190245 Transcript_67061/m.190245 type:complete len:214 (-) Transcript_67061:315-956(-)
MLAVEVHLATAMRGRCHIVGPPAHEGDDIVLQGRHPEAREVGEERHLSEVLRGGLDLRLVGYRHVLLPHLLVVLPTAGVGRLHFKPLGEDVRELGSVTVAPASDLPLAVVVVVAGQQLAKDKLGHVALVLLVDRDRQPLAVVPDSDEAACAVDLDADRVLRSGPHQVVRSVDQDLVENLVQGRHVLQFLARHALASAVIHKVLLRLPLNGPHI